jgi:FtsP/CotA-like multicopper oxidase with cupredoxin domain
MYSRRTPAPHVSKARLKAIEDATQNRRALIAAQLSRRELMKMGLVTASGMLVAKYGLSARAASADGSTPVNNPVSPPITPFTVPLTIRTPTDLRTGAVHPISALSPAPTVVPNVAAGEGRVISHQALLAHPPTSCFEVHERPGQHSFHPELPVQTIWGYNGECPGPTYLASYGTPTLIRMHNDLPPLDQRPVGGFGRADTSCHLHNGHTPSESDGNPMDFFGPGKFYDHHYPNIPAGGDAREKMSTLWYHDHRVGFTSQNVYKGLTGFYLLFDEQDCGDETRGFRLPSGAFDVPLTLTDKVFDSDGIAFFDLFNLDGVLGDKFVVNGAIQPFFEVHPRKYRFRILNTGPSRFYELYLTDLDRPGTNIPLVQISADGNLLPTPLPGEHVRISVAERVDVIVDFSLFKPGARIYLENRLEQQNGRGPTGKILPAGQGNLLMRFDVTLPRVDDPSQIPARLREFPEVDLDEVVATRTWRFERRQGAWAINGKFFDPDEVRATVKEGTAEIWTFQNNSGGWQHPVHVHFEEFLILSRNGQPAALNDHRKDMARLEFNEEVKMFMRFRDFHGKYPLHCHNVVHEDHDMMLRWDIVP